MRLAGGEKVDRPLAHNKGELSKEKSVERLISILGAFQRKMNNVREGKYE